MILEIIGTLFLALLSAWLYNYSYYYQYLRKIPAPRVWPIVGNMLLFRKAHKTLETFPYWMKMLNTKTFRIHRPFSTSLITFDYKLIEHVLSSSTIVNKGYHYTFFDGWLGSGLFTSSGPKWRKQRKMITPTFHFQILEQFVDIFNTNAAILVARLKQKVHDPSVDIFNYMTLCTLDSICETAMGTKVNAQLQESSDYVKAVHTMTNLVPERVSNPICQIKALYKFTSLYEKEQKALKVLHSYTDNVIQNRRRQIQEQGGKFENLQEEDDLGRKKRMPFLDMLFQATIDGKPLTDKEIRDEVSTFMFAGHDTTATAMSYALYALANNPECQQKAFEELFDIYGDDVERTPTFHELQEMKYLDLVIKETLRMYPSAPYFIRTITEDFTFDGITYPKNVSIAISAYHIQHDPEYFPDPEKFDPERFSKERYNGKQPYSFIPFSAGPRNCVGQKFAFFEMKSTLSTILRNFVLKPATPGHNLELMAATVLKSMNGVKISFENRVY